MKVNSSALNRFWDLLVSVKKDIVPIYFYAIMNGLLQLAVPLGVQAIIGFVIGAAMVSSIYVLIFIVVVAVFMVGVMQIKQMQVIEKIQQKIFTRFSFEFAKTIPQIDLYHQNKVYLPEKVNRFFDTINIQKGVSKLLLEIPIASIQILLGLILLTLYHPIFIIFGLILILILWLILRVTWKNGLRTSLKESSFKYSLAAWLEEVALNIKSFKHSKGTNINLHKTDENLVGYLTSRTEHFKVLLFQYWSLVMFKVAITVGMLGVGSFLLIEQQLNIGEFIAAEIIIIMVISAVEKLIINLDSVYDVITGLEKISRVLDLEMEKNGNQKFIPNNQGIDVQFINFNFNFDDEPNLLENVNVHIPANSIVCVQGELGSGKSSLLKILSLYYQKFNGTLLYNQIPCTQFSQESLRPHIGTFQHQYEIFNGSILENISLGRVEISYEKVIEKLKEMKIDNYFNTLKDNLETEVFPMGSNIPSTVLRIVMILRAIINNPALLLMEEPWKDMRPKDSEHLKKYLLEFKKQSTIFIVSNDEEFAAQCDYILKIEGKHIQTIQNHGTK
jgi:ABC-type bacteriocin/lantibiotic exporter with double-glycine peptidase domain